MITGIHLGTVVGSEIKVNRDGENEVRMLSAELTEANDVQSIELISQNGEQTNPQDDTGVVILDFGRSWKIAIAVRDNVEPDSGLARGEKIIYSVDENRTIKASVRFKVDGTLVLNEGTDWAVQYTALKSAFDQLKSDLNTFISVFNAHVHTSACTAGGTPTLVSTTSGSTSSADMSNAKIEEIQVP